MIDPGPTNDERVRLQDRPSQKAVMRQSWRNLTFLHFPIDPGIIQATLPDGLTVDTFDGMAWIGLVPFEMLDVRPVGFPSVKGLSDFPETNVRTYCHRGGVDPGVWFYSLDAAQPIACALARKFFSLPYHESSMTVTMSEDTIRYQSKRVRTGARCNARVVAGKPLRSPEPGSLEFFLVERYLLYAAKQDRLFTGRVHHIPYPLQSVEVEELDETVVKAAGLPSHPFIHRCFSAGVDVEVFPLRAV